MVKKIFIYAFLLFALVYSNSEAKLKFILEPGTSYHVGDNEYELSLSFRYDSNSTTVTEQLRSLLEFPEDGFMLGANFYLFDPFQKDIWYVSGGIHTNISNPSDKMMDSDWYGIEPYLPYTKFSYTESDAENRIINTDLHVARHIKYINSVNIYMVFGFRYQYFKQEIVGYEGWQRVLDTVSLEYSDPIDVLGNAPAIDYILKIKQPYIGLRALFNFGYIESELMAAFAPIFYSNEDDHLLRYKLSTSDGDGEGFIADYSIKFDINRERDVYLKFKAAYSYFNATGKQEQYWYQDETSGGDIIVPQGTRFTGIPHEIKGTSYDIGAFLGMGF